MSYLQGNRPDLVVHADWGSAPAKRWMATARRGDDGRYRVAAPEPVGPVETWVERIRARAPGRRVLAGFDFPLGLPAAYAARAGISEFREALLAFGTGDWHAFYQIAEQSGDIDLRRPFYPYRPGGTRRHHLADGLGLPDFGSLLRRCDRPTADRRAAGALFWTMGAQQSGRGAIIGWRDVIAPALRRFPTQVRLWPFEGDLDALLTRPGLVVAEVYPAEAALHLGLTPPGTGWSKRTTPGRADRADALLGWAEKRTVSLSPEMEWQIQAGFGQTAMGEDAFDATLGLFGMLEVVLGHRAPGPPPSPDVRRVEGWILGLGA